MLLIAKIFKNWNIPFTLRLSEDRKGNRLISE